MSQKQAKTTVRQSTHDAIEEMERTLSLEYRSDAIRLALRHGLSDMGYLSDGSCITPARRIVREVGKLLLIVSATLATLSVTAGLAFFGAAAGVFAAAAAVFAADRWLLPRMEPDLTNRLPRISIKHRRDAW
jgi:hypothetical protein